SRTSSPSSIRIRNRQAVEKPKAGMVPGVEILSDSLRAMPPATALDSDSEGGRGAGAAGFVGEHWADLVSVTPTTDDAEDLGVARGVHPGVDDRGTRVVDGLLH